jgi:hypothetical protein
MSRDHSNCHYYVYKITDIKQLTFWGKKLFNIFN